MTSGGFAIAGCHTNDITDSSRANQTLWVIRTDENYNPVWNKTYGKTVHIRSITEMNNGDLAIGHYIEGFPDFEGKGRFQILVIDDEGEYVRDQSWRFGWLSGFLHCQDGGFIIAKEIYDTPDASPYWMARIDTDLSVIWNKTYPSFASGTDIIEDMAGGFTMPLEQGLDGPIGIVRLDKQGEEISRVFTNSTEVAVHLWLTQCSNGEYLGWSGDYIIRFDLEGNILWEKNVDFYVHGIKELSPNRFVAFERSGRKYDWNPGVHLECFDAGGTTNWTRSVQAANFFVPDIICNTDGGLTILGMVDSNHLSYVLHEISLEAPFDFDVCLLDVDQDGNLVQNATYDANLRFGDVPFWGKITELATGGFAIAGYHENDTADLDPDNHQLWVIRTDENYNPLWNRSYGETFEIRSITEMNNGDLAIGHYIESYGYKRSTFQILVIDDEGEYVREQSWRFGDGWASGFAHCDDGGFIIAKEIYNTPNASPFWMARIGTNLSVIWNKTYPSFATHTDIFEDMAGGFTMPLEPGLDGPIGIVRLDNDGNEISRVFTNSTETRQYLTLTQCSNAEYLAGGPGYIIRFNIDGEILWEMDVDFYVHGIQELSPDRFVAFRAAGVRENGWDYPGAYLECFNSSGTTIWSRSVHAAGFFAPDIIYNTNGGFTILGMIASNYLSFVLDDFSETTTEAAIYLAATQFSHSLLCSDSRFSQSTGVLRIESLKMVMD
jgi:hypothetical protein